MDLALYAVQAVLVEGRSVRKVAGATGRSKSWVQRHVALYRLGGEEALVPRRRGPKTSPNQTPAATEDAIVRLRKQLGELGLDAGSRTIAYHLASKGLVVPALSTIHRILVRRGFVTPQPQKRPRSSWQRFEADLPNECWQSDMTHWQLRDASGVEIVNFIDDHSRAVMASVAVEVATAPEVVRIFFRAAAVYGLPRSVLSDNGAIYTAAYRGAATGLEIELSALGITFKHGKPYHPQTQGKVCEHHVPTPARQGPFGPAGSDRPFRPRLQRGAAPPGTGMPADAGVALTRPGDPDARGQATASCDQGAPRQGGHHRRRHPPAPLEAPPHRARTRSQGPKGAAARLRPRHHRRRRQRRGASTPQTGPVGRLPGDLTRYGLRVRLSQKSRDRTKRPREDSNLRPSA